MSAKLSCYACDANAIGVRDQRPEGGDVVPACGRHAEVTLGELLPLTPPTLVWRAVAALAETVEQGATA